MGRCRFRSSLQVVPSLWGQPLLFVRSLDVLPVAFLPSRWRLQRGTQGHGSASDRPGPSGAAWGSGLILSPLTIQLPVDGWESSRE